MYVIMKKNGKRVTQYDEEQLGNMTKSVSYHNNHSNSCYKDAEIHLMQLTTVAKFPATKAGIAALKEFEKNENSKPQIGPDTMVPGLM